MTMLILEIACGIVLGVIILSLLDWIILSLICLAGLAVLLGLGAWIASLPFSTPGAAYLVAFSVVIGVPIMIYQWISEQL
jgi:hypothetical protein